MFSPYLTGLSAVVNLPIQKPINSGCSDNFGKWNISKASVGTEELAHLEIVATIIHQLTRDLSMEEIEESGFANYYVDHTIGIWPQSAGGFPFSAAQFQSTGDIITDLTEDMAADEAVM